MMFLFTRNPDYYALLSYKKNNPTGRTQGLENLFYGIANTNNSPNGGQMFAMYAIGSNYIDPMLDLLMMNKEQKESIRGVPTEIPFAQMAIVDVNKSVTGLSSVYSLKNSASLPSMARSVLLPNATGGIALILPDGSLGFDNMLFAAGFGASAMFKDANSSIPVNIMPISSDSEHSGMHDSYYWTLGVGYEVGPAGLSLTYIDSRTQQSDAWGGRSKLQNIVAGMDYEVIKGFVPYIEVSFFKTEDKTYGLIDVSQFSLKYSVTKILPPPPPPPPPPPVIVDNMMIDNKSGTGYAVLQDTLFAKLYGDALYPFDSTDKSGFLSEEAVRNSISNKNEGYLIMIGVKFKF